MIIKDFFIALSSGFIAGLVNILGVWSFSIIQGSFQFSPLFIYKQAFWGGLWGLLYCLPILKEQWIIRGLVVSTAASITTFFIFQAIPLTPFNIFRSFIVNTLLWGGASSYLYHKYSEIK